MNPLTLLQKVLVGAVVVLVIIVALQQWRLENATEKLGAAGQALHQAREDNKAWTESEKRHEAFVREVQAGFTEMQRKFDAVRQTNQTYQQQVRSHANANDPLTADERRALQLWGQSGPAHPADAGQGRNPATPEGMRR